MLTIEVLLKGSVMTEKSVAECKFPNSEVLTGNTLSKAIDFSNIIRFQITRNLRKKELKKPTTGSAPSPPPPLPRTNVIV